MQFVRRLCELSVFLLSQTFLHPLNSPVLGFPKRLLLAPWQYATTQSYTLGKTETDTETVHRLAKSNGCFHVTTIKNYC